MNNIKLSLIAASTFFAVVSASSQTLPDKLKVSTPAFIENINGAERGIGEHQLWQDWALAQIKRGKLGKDTYAVWTVYSDRNNNPVYSSPSYGSPVKYLSFRDKLVVADIEGDFALVYTDENRTNYPKINPSARCVGWVPFDNLILWNECPKSKSSILQKALIVRGTSKEDADANEKDPAYYMAPESASQRDDSRRVKDLDFLFVVKKNTVKGKTWYLLSKEMNWKDKEGVVQGWLPSGYVTEWDQRLTIEPTHASSVISEYKSLNLMPVIFDDKKIDNARQWVSGAETKGALWAYDAFSSKRMPAYIMRNPILADEGDNVFNVAAIASTLERDKANDPALAAKNAEMQKRLNNINIIFVIDATSSMKRYYQPVINALENVARLDVGEGEIRVGAVVYRDYPDKRGLGTVEYKKVTNKIDDVISFLRGIETKSDDPDDWEAMFEGLSTALDTRTMGYGAKESNFLILVGDAGNRRSNPENGNAWQAMADGIAGMLSENNISFTAHQVNHGGKPAYDDFSRQVGLIQKLYSQMVAKKLRSDVEYVTNSEGEYKLVRTSSSNDLPIYDTYKFAKNGHSESPNNLQFKVINQIKEFRSVVQDNIEATRISHVTGGLQEKRVEDVLRMNGWTEEQIRKRMEYLRNGGSSKFIGYAPEKCALAKNKIFDYVLFFSQAELVKLVNQLSKINSSYASERQAYYDAFVAMGQAMLGQFDAEQIKGMSTDQLLRQIYGVPIQLPATGLTLKEILTVDMRTLEKYIDRFKDQIDVLKRILNGNYDGRFESNGETYYWIPITAMPGMQVID